AGTWSIICRLLMSTRIRVRIRSASGILSASGIRRCCSLAQLLFRWFLICVLLLGCGSVGFSLLRRSRRGGVIVATGNRLAQLDKRCADILPEIINERAENYRKRDSDNAARGSASEMRRILRSR